MCRGQAGAEERGKVATPGQLPRSPFLDLEDDALKGSEITSALPTIGTHLILELWRYTDFPLLCTISRCQISSR